MKILLNFYISIINACIWQLPGEDGQYLHKQGLAHYLCQEAERKHPVWSVTSWNRVEAAVNEAICLFIADEIHNYNFCFISM